MDTSSILRCQERYPAENFPTMWDKLSQLIDDGRLVSSEEVLLELKRKEGDIAYAWAKSHAQVFLPPVEAVQREVTTIMADFRKLVDER